MSSDGGLNGDVELLQRVVGAALATLEANRSRIDDLNVYPVPDGDTGTNLTMTVRALAEAVESTSAASRHSLARDAARGALMGARGNSGVIFSQIVRGAADVLGETSSPSTIDAQLAAQALRGASDAAYRAVRRPVEGTMLSVIRELAEEAEARAGDGPPLEDLLADLVRRGELAVARTPEQLQVLRDAGVVDAGGAGLLELVRGVSAAVNGEPVSEAPRSGDERAAVEAIHQELSQYRYCTVFLIEGDELDRDALEAQLEQLGDSLLVVGDASALKVHVHTDDPGAALSLGSAAGAISGVEIANMHEQTKERARRLRAVPAAKRATTGVVAVVAGEGNRLLFESLAGELGPIRIVEGGQTMNPSTAELLRAVDSLDADEALILPNNSNVLLAAEHAAANAEKPVQVVAADSIPAGLAAMVAFDGARDAAANAEEMRAAIAAVTTGEVTVASRDVEIDGLAIRKGEWLGLAAGRAVAGGDGFEDVALAVVEQLLGEPRGLLTLLVGSDEPPLAGLLEQIAAAYPELELDVHQGGQPHYPLLLSAE
jgi:DAK2 domain fusion protein YloV